MKLRVQVIEVFGVSGSGRFPSGSPDSRRRVRATIASVNVEMDERFRSLVGLLGCRCRRAAKQASEAIAADDVHGGGVEHDGVAGAFARAATALIQIPDSGDAGLMESLRSGGRIIATDAAEVFANALTRRLHEVR